MTIGEGIKMFKLSNSRVVLLAILVFSFAYRLLLMLWANYPPGADIGLHESVINSIIGHGNVDFLYNAYQMGGGLSLTFPGFHIFVSYVILLTGIPDYLAQTLVVSLFSTLTVAIAFLVTKKLWGVSTAFIVAFMVAVSRFDIEMLLWAGYPNVVTLALIPLVFYLYLHRERFSLTPFLAVTSLLVGTLFLTHSLSAVIFVSLTFVFVVVGLVLHRKIGMTLKQLTLWVLPIFLGAAIVSPFLINAVPAYLGANSETYTGGVSDISQATLSTRVLPLEWVVPLFVCVILFFLFSKEYKGKYLTVHSVLLTLWIWVPMIFTQGYLVGVYTDYNRFLYYVLLPLFILIGVGVNHIARLLADVTHTYIASERQKPQLWKELKQLELRLKPRLTEKNLFSGFLLGILLFMFLAVPFLVTPWEGHTVQSFYQVMTQPGYEAIQWAKNNTAPGSVFVSDALYGWWFGGFAQRPTLSAVDPQYLALSREFLPAQAAKNLLDSDYVVDNGLIQVREDGGYVSRHNPMFLGRLNWTYFPYPFFNFNNGDAKVALSVGGDVKFFTLSQLSVLEMKLQNNSDQAEITVKKGNGLFNFTEVLTVYEGRKFVNMTLAIESVANEVSLLSFDSVLHIRGTLINKTDTVGLFEEGSKVFGQLIYAENHPAEVNLITPENPSGLEFVYNLHGNTSAELQLFVSAFSVSDSPATYPADTLIWENPYLNGLLDGNVANYLFPDQDQSRATALDALDYRAALVDWNISYIACRDSGLYPKFAKDPAFSTVFINNEVAVFKVKSNSFS
jgi:hypothetical protein